MHARAAPLIRALFAALALLLPTTAQAQDWGQPWADPEDRPPRVDLSASIGVLVPTDWSNLVLLGSISSASGIVEQIVSRELRVEPDTSYGAALTYWEGRYGFRVQGGLSRSTLKIGGVPLGTAETSAGVRAEGQPASTRINTWLYDVRAAIGFLEYDPGRVVLPYGFVGVGGITYDLARTVSPPLTFVTQGPALPEAGGVVVVRGNGRQFVLAEDELGVKTVFAFDFGLGSDFRIPLGHGGVGIRVEASDHVAPSPLGLRITELSSSSALLSDGRVGFGRVHHLSVSAGVVLQIGR